MRPAPEGTSLLLALVALSACSHVPWSGQIPPSEADRLVRDADAQIRAGRPSLAVAILDDVVRRFPDASVHDQALYELALALVLSANGGGGVPPGRGATRSAAA